MEICVSKYTYIYIYTSARHFVYILYSLSHNIIIVYAKNIVYPTVWHNLLLGQICFFFHIIFLIHNIYHNILRRKLKSRLTLDATLLRVWSNKKTSSNASLKKTPQVDLTFPGSDMCEINTSPPVTCRAYIRATADDDSLSAELLEWTRTYPSSPPGIGCYSEKSGKRERKRERKISAYVSPHSVSYIYGYPWLIEINDVFL